MEIEKIWTRFNMSFILVLPLFKSIIENIKTKDNYNISIQSLFCEYGLINTYLLNDNFKYDKTLKLVFKKESILVCDLLDKIDKPVASLLDLLISSKYFYTIKQLDNHIVVYLKIDDEWEKDIKKIITSQYSKISDSYRDFITYKGDYTLSNDELLNYLYVKNIPAKIVIKHDSLQQIIKNIFNYDGEDSELPEVFPAFDKNRESLDLKTLE